MRVPTTGFDGTAGKYISDGLKINEACRLGSRVRVVPTAVRGRCAVMVGTGWALSGQMNSGGGAGGFLDQVFSRR